MKKPVFFLLSVFLFISCGKELETITVKSDTTELLDAPADSVYDDIAPSTDDFVQIRFGEIAPIESLDPLYATSNSEWRVINLIYEGLTSLNSFGNPAPGLAKRWVVNDDSTQFTFHLRTNVYFHDSPAFESGKGRRFTAKDVRYVFERMANNNVPDFTANHFQDIRGFSAFHNEQTFVKNPVKRVLKTIEGIKLPNDSTVVFYTNKTASDFLVRLAHPMASIYASESVPSGNGPIQKAAGTDRFSFIKKEDNAHLLTQNTAYRGFSPKVNRLDIISGLSETDLYQQFAQNNLDALIELGSSTLISIADSSGQLLNSFEGSYVLNETPVGSDYSFYFNQDSGQEGPLNTLIQNVDPQNLLPFAFLGNVSLNQVESTTESPNESTQLIVTQSGHPFERYLLDQLATTATGQSFTVSMNASYALSEDVTLSTKPYPGTQEYLRWEAPVYILHNTSISGISIEHEPWNLSLVSIKTSGGN